MNTTATEPSWQFSMALYMALGGRTFRFLKQPGAQANTEVYAGETLPGSEPIGIKTLINRILSTFQLSLPDAIPDVLFDDVRGAITRTSTPDPQGKAPSSVSATYQFSATGRTQASQPFGSHIPVAEFTRFCLQLQSSSASESTSVFLSCGVAFDPDITFLPGNLQALLVLSQNANVISFTVGETLSSSQLIGQLLNTSVDQQVQDFLPSIGPLSATQPMRVYQASETVTVEADGSSTVYQQGFNLDQAVIEVLGLRFALILNVHNGFTIGAAVERLDLGILSLGQPTQVLPGILNPGLSGALIEVVNQAAAGGARTTSISLASEVVFLGDVRVDLAASYTAATKTFAGTVVYPGSVLGIAHPSLSVAWSQAKGFQILDFPLPAGELAQIIDFAKEIKQLFNAGQDGCQKLVDFTFSKIITTGFKVNVKPGSANGKPQLSISGTYTVYVAGYDVVDVDFSPLDVPLTVPKGLDDVGNAILATLKDSATALATALYNNRASLTKLLGAIALQTGAQQAASSFICRFGKESLQNLVDEAADAAAGSAASGAASGMGSLAAAAGVFTAATAALSFFAKILDCLTDSQKDQRKQAQKDRQAAQDKINALLQVNNLSASCQYASEQLQLLVSWAELSEPDSSTLDLTVRGANGDIVYQQNGLDGHTTSWLVPVNACDAYAIGVNGVYAYQGMTFEGNAANASVSVSRLSVAPARVGYSESQNQLSVAWDAAAPVSLPGVLLPVLPIRYQVELWDETLEQAVDGMSRTVDADQPLQVNFDLVSPGPPVFHPQPSHSYAIHLSAQAGNAMFNSGPSVTPLPALRSGVGHTLIGLSFTVS